MLFILIYSIWPFLLVGISIFLLDRFTKINSILKTIIGTLPLLVYIIFIVENERLWQPSAGLGVLFFMFAVFVGGFVAFLLILFLAKLDKLKKGNTLIALTITIMSPFLVLAISQTSNWVHISQYYSKYCFSTEGKDYYLHLDSADSSSYIAEILGPGVTAGYFNGSYTQKQDSIIVSGEKVITYNTLEDRTYIVSKNKFYGFSSDSTSIFIEECR